MSETETKESMKDKVSSLLGIVNRTAKTLIGPTLASWAGYKPTTLMYITTLAPQDLKARAEMIMLQHNLFDKSNLPQGTKASLQTCPLANIFGGEIYTDSLLAMPFLDALERLILLEFIERFDRGDYPDLVKNIRPSSE